MNWSDRIHRVEKLIDGAFYTSNLSHIYYLTGLKLSKGGLLLQKKKTCLFVDSRYTEYAQKASLPVKTLSFDSLKETVDVKPLYIDPSDCSYLEGDDLIKKVGAKPFTNVNPIILVRAQKEEGEVRLLRKSCLLLHKGYEHIRKKVRLGISEKELALEFELFVRKHGAEKLAFEPIIAFGANAAMPHHRSGGSKLKKNSVVLMDLGVVFNSYASDMTRCFFYGMVSEKMQTLYTTVERAQEAAVEHLHVGNSLRQIDQAVREVFKEQGMEKYYLHALGHGVGLEVHEYPILSAHRSPKDATLLENMVVAIEPGLYLPRVGGVRLEEMYLITKGGPKKLTV